MRVISTFRQSLKKKVVICEKLHPSSATRSCYQYHHHGGRLVAFSTKTIRTTDQERADSNLDRHRAADRDDNLKERQGRTGRKRPLDGAKPLFFQRTPRCDPSSLSSSSQDNATTRLSTITPYDLKGTTANLPPSYWHSSPCLGAALSNSPFVGNLMKYYQLTNAAGVEDTSCDDDDLQRICFHLDQASRLSHLLFFRLIPESPIHLVRNKSMPGSLVTPGIIGSYLSNYWTGSTYDACSNSHISHHDDRTTRTKNENRSKRKRKKKLSTKDDTSRRMLQDLLRSRFGIRSNRIGNNDEWTGISMARWMELHVPRIPRPSSRVVVNDIQDSQTKTKAAVAPSKSSSQLLADVLVPALWLVALWGITGTRWNFQEYRSSLLNQEDGTNPHPSSVFQASDFSKPNISAAMDRLLTFYSQPRHFDSLDSHEDDSGEIKSVAEAFELVCVAIALTKTPDESSPMPQPIPNGYYMYGSDAEVFVPDCVEVAIREILQFLLFPDDSTKNERNGAAIDLSKLPSTASDRLRELLMQQQYQQGPEYKDHPLKQQQSPLGQLWFNLLSDLPPCEYFVSTPSGTKYELTPTVENICTALWCLLVDGHNDDDDTSNIGNMRLSENDTTWKTLEDLAEFWNSLHPIDETTNKLFVRQDTLRHIRPSTGDIMEHEVAYLQLERNPNALEIRLRCDWTDESGMAAVTHLRESPSNDESLFEADKVDLLLDLLKSKYDSSTDSNDSQQRDPSLAMLCLALLPFRSEAYAECEDLSLFSLACLSTAYGIDRRGLLLKHDDESVFERETSYEEALIDSRKILKERILQCCDFATYNPLVGKRLLTWILQESPTVMESSLSSISGPRKILFDANIEDCISKLPIEAMDDQLFDAIQFNWACRGRALSALLQLRSGNMTPTQLVFSMFYGKLGLGDLVDMMDLYRHNRDD